MVTLFCKSGLILAPNHNEGILCPVISGNYLPRLLEKFILHDAVIAVAAVVVIITARLILPLKRMLYII